MEFDPKYARASNNLAWLLATAEEPSMRHGRRASEVPRKACELSACQDAYLLGQCDQYDVWNTGSNRVAFFVESSCAILVG